MFTRTLGLVAALALTASAAPQAITISASSIAGSAKSSVFSVESSILSAQSTASASAKSSLFSAESSILSAQSTASAASAKSSLFSAESSILSAQSTASASAKSSLFSVESSILSVQSTASAASVSATSTANPTNIPGTCEYTYNACLTSGDPNFSACVSAFNVCKASSSSATQRATTTTDDIVVYTTVCPLTSVHTVGDKTYTEIYTTTSTITSCKGGCHPTTTTTASVNPTNVPGTCEYTYNECLTSGDPNFSACVSAFDTCKAASSSTTQAAYTTEDITVYTTVCPVTEYATVGTVVHTSIYTTTSTVTSCKGGCHAKTTSPATTTSPAASTSSLVPGTCEYTYNQCLTSGDPNFSACVSAFDTCKASTSSTTVAATTPAASKSSPAASASTLIPGTCEYTYNQCLSSGDPNFSACVSAFDVCKASTSSTVAAATSPAATSPAATTPAATTPAATSPAATTATPETVSTTSGSTAATTSAVQFTGAASSLMVGSMGFAGAFAAVVLLI